MGTTMEFGVGGCYEWGSTICVGDELAKALTAD